MNKQNEEPEVEKKEYRSPVLTGYGTLETITNGAGNTGTDGILGSRNKA